MSRQLLLDLLTSQYGARRPTLSPIYEHPTRAIYRVDDAGAPPWVLRLYPSRRPLNRLHEQAAIMRHVAQRAIPAERVIPTSTGEISTVLGDRGVLVTTYLTGSTP